MDSGNDLRSLRMRLIESIGLEYLQLWENVRDANETHDKLSQLVEIFGAEDIKRSIAERARETPAASVPMPYSSAALSGVDQLLSIQPHANPYASVSADIASTAHALCALRLTGPTAPPPSYQTESMAGSEGRGRVKFEGPDGSTDRHRNLAAKRERLPRSAETYRCAQDGTSMLMKQTLVSEGPLSIARALELTIHVLMQLREMQEHGIIYKRIKPANVCFCEKHGYLLVPAQGKHCEVEELYKKKAERLGKPGRGDGHGQGTAEVLGNLRYKPLAAHEGVVMTPEDSVESLVYMVKKMVTGKLPWDNVKPTRVNEKNKEIYKLKRRTQPFALCKRLPHLFTQLLRAARAGAKYSRRKAKQIGEAVKPALHKSTSFLKWLGKTGKKRSGILKKVKKTLRTGASAFNFSEWIERLRRYLNKTYPKLRSLANHGFSEHFMNFTKKAIEGKNPPC